MEFVFVVPRATLFPTHAPHGLVRFSPAEEEADGTGCQAESQAGSQAESQTWPQGEFQRCVSTDGFFVERAYAERTPALKQVIPYTLVVRGGDILLLRRTKGGGETRLHDKLTIGVGGHVNPVDATPSGDGATSDRSKSSTDPLASATRREVMDEELIVTGPTRLSAIGLINDDSNPVGAVHVGLVQILHLDEKGDAQVRETEQLEGEFVPAKDLPGRLAAGANFETWSSLIVPHLDRMLSPCEDALHKDVLHHGSGRETGRGDGASSPSLVNNGATAPA